MSYFFFIFFIKLKIVVIFDKKKLIFRFNDLKYVIKN